MRTWAGRLKPSGTGGSAITVGHLRLILASCHNQLREEWKEGDCICRRSGVEEMMSLARNVAKKMRIECQAVAIDVNSMRGNAGMIMMSLGLHGVKKMGYRWAVPRTGLWNDEMP